MTRPNNLCTLLEDLNMSNLVNIASGWYHYMKGDMKTRRRMETRLKICDTCPEKQALGTMVQGAVKLISTDGSVFKCRMCSCPLSPKVASPQEECPKKLWLTETSISFY